MFVKVLPARFLAFMLMVVCVCLSHPAIAAAPSAAGSATASPSVSPSESNTASKKELFRNIDGLCLYEVVGGQRRKIHFSRSDLESGKAIDLKGYVSGIVLTSPSPKLAVTLEGLRTDHQDRGPGIEGDAAREMDVEKRLDTSQYRYSFFPGVPGDIVSPKDQFCLSIHDGNARQTLTIHQNGYQCIPAAIQEPSDRRYKAPVFRYAGSDFSRFQGALSDLEERLEAVKSGIRRVESAFGLKLVDFVNILPYKGPDNALSLRGKSQVWFYAHTIRFQRVSELRSMAEHEALHILVDRLGFIRKSSLKELFSDLLGYGLFSRERFLLVTTGALPDPALRSQRPVNPFLVFINERNFIPGMSGGHAGDSLDEFSVSFLHSLLYLDHLKQNFAKSRLLTGNGNLMPITVATRRTIRKDYLRTLTVFTDAAPDRIELFSSTRDFFEKSMPTESRIPPESLNAAY